MSVRRAVKARLLARPLVLAANAAAIVALARLLTPEQFGAFAIAAVTVQIAQAVGGFGLRPQLVRAPTLDPAAHRAAVGLSLALCCALALTIATVATRAPQSLFGEETALCLAALSLKLLFTPIAIAQEVPLTRRLRFGLLTAISVGQAATRGAVAVGFAASGFGALSLAIGALAETALSAIVLATAGRSGPFPWPSVSGWRALLRDGVRIGASDLLWRAGDAAVISGIAGFLGAAAVGFYNRADRVMRLFDSAVLESIKPVALPAISRAMKRGDRPSDIYLMKIEYLSGLTWPAFAMIAVLAQPLCAVLLGPTWEGISLLVLTLALMGFFKPFTKMSQSMLIAMDRAGEALRLQATHHATRAALAIGGAMVSLEAVCLGLTLAHALHAARLTLAFKRATGYERSALVRILARSGVLAAATAVFGAAASGAVPTSSDLVALGAAGAAGGAAWVLAAAVLRHPLLGEALLACGARRQARLFGVERYAPDTGALGRPAAPDEVG